jgi:hypothetical protein
MKIEMGMCWKRVTAAAVESAVVMIVLAVVVVVGNQMLMMTDDRQISQSQNSTNRADDCVHRKGQTANRPIIYISEAGEHTKLAKKCEQCEFGLLRQRHPTQKECSAGQQEERRSLCNACEPS